MSTRRALTFSFVDRYAGLIIHTLTAMVIARLLTPSEIGVYSVTMVLIGFVATFRDLGAGQYLIQKQNLASDDARAVWAVQLGLGLFFAAIIAAGSLPTATFYREPRIVGIMMVVALNFALTPFLAYPNAWLVREMQFGALAVIRFSSAIATAMIAIGLTWADFGPISLAWSNLAGTLVSILVTGALGHARLRWIPRISGARQVISFGGQITLVTLFGTIKSATPELFLGRLQGMTDTGLFSRGQGLVAMFERLVMDAVSAVAIPFFAKQMRDGEKLSDSFLHASSLVTVLGWSFLGCLGILAFPAIRVLYGDQWDQSVDPTRWLAAAMAFGVPASVCLPPLLACGAVSKVLRTTALATSINVALAGIGAYFGLLTLTQLLVPGAALSSAAWLTLTKRELGFTWQKLFASFARSAVVALAAASIPLATTIYVGWRSPNTIMTLLIAVPGATIGFLAASCLTRHAIWEEISRAVKGVRS